MGNDLFAECEFYFRGGSQGALPSAVCQCLNHTAILNVHVGVLTGRMVALVVPGEAAVSMAGLCV